MVLPISRIATRTASRSLASGKNKAWFWGHHSPPLTMSTARGVGFASAASGGGGFSMDLLKDLRARSGAPIVDCKTALQHSENDLSTALQWLREHGAAASTKLTGRETDEGIVGLSVSNDGKSASLVQLASETDFASRSEMCVDLVLNVANATLAPSTSPQAGGYLDGDAILETESTLADGQTVKDLLDDTIVAIRENLSIETAYRMKAKRGILFGYVHNRIDAAKDAGTAAAVVELATLEGGKEVPDETLQAVGKKLAMHIVAARPQYLSPDDVPASELEKEKEILTKQLEGSGKPPELVEKIVLGKLRKFYSGVCLTEQAHMIEAKNPKVGKVLKDHGIAIEQFESLSIS